MQIPQQHHRARPPTNQEENAPDDGFKKFHAAQWTLAGIEVRVMIKKGHLRTPNLPQKFSIPSRRSAGNQSNAFSSPWSICDKRCPVEGMSYGAAVYHKSAVGAGLVLIVRFF